MRGINVSEVKFKNADKGLCVICGEHIEMFSVWICRQCLKLCEVDDSRILEETKDKMLIDVKSKCCNTDVQSIGRLTCSEKCHEEFVKRLEKEFGAAKKVVDQVTGTVYKIPTRDLIEKGLTWENLHRYPVWNDVHIN